MKKMNKDNKGTQHKNPKTYGFSLVNLWILLASLFILLIGYILLSGGQSADSINFNAEVFSTRRIKVAPILLTMGYVGILVAVLWRGKKRVQIENDKDSE